MAYKPYKMRGHTLPGIKQKQSPAKHRRTKSTAITHEDASAHNRLAATESHYGHPHGDKPEKESPAKCPLLAALPAITGAIGAVGSLKKKKEEQ